MSLLKIILYSTSANKEPFAEWLAALDPTVRATVLAAAKASELS